MLEVLIVSRDDSPRSFLTKLFEHTLGNGTTNLRLRAGTELIDEDQRLV